MIVNFPLLVFVLCFAVLLLATILGDVLRRRRHLSREDEKEDFGVVLTGALTLLGLVIGFSISMAISRYDLRKSCELTEVNAIGTEYSRTGLLSTADAARVRELLRTYLDKRMLLYTTRDQRQLTKIDADSRELQHKLLSTIYSGIAAASPPLQGLLVSGMNDVVNSKRLTDGAWENRLPVAVWILLIAVSGGCSFLVGYRARRTDWLVFLVIPFAVSISLFLISDLDSARGGSIRVVPMNLTTLSESLSQ